MNVSLVARQHGIAPNQLFAWRRMMTQGALTAASAGEEVVPASDYRALEAQVRKLQRMLGKKTREKEILAAQQIGVRLDDLPLARMAYMRCWRKELLQQRLSGIGQNHLAKPNLHGHTALEWRRSISLISFGSLQSC